MLKCLNGNRCNLKGILDILCHNKRFECKEGNLGEIIRFLKRKNAKGVIFLIKGNLTQREAYKYVFIVSEISKTKNIVYAAIKNKKLGFKVLIAH